MDIKRALVSVANKSNLETLAQFLIQKKVETVSTGGTAVALKKLGVEVKDVSEVTGFPEIMGGRVKSLHPKVHMALLARKNHAEDKATLEEFSTQAFDLVVGNLYPFEEGLKNSKTEKDQIELIDIGGPSFLRSASKSFERIVVISDPKDYPILTENKIDLQMRKKLAVKVFKMTSKYDQMIAGWLEGGEAGLELKAKKHMDLRYGENPDQKASWYVSETKGLHEAQILHGKALSYNNLLDLEALAQSLKTLGPTGAVAVKHNNPCGLAEFSNPHQSFIGALKGDPLSVFGGLVGVNFKMEIAQAQELSKMFVECVLAPEYSAEALECLKSKKNIRLLAWPEIVTHKTSKSQKVKSIWGGYLLQDQDKVQDWPESWKVLGRPIDESLKRSLSLAWKSASLLKSNAIAIISGSQSVGFGMGQVSRVDAVEQALARQKKFHPEAKNLILASDAFFPFKDSIELAASHGVEWVIQPGGSIRDEEVIETAQSLGMGMVLTGRRHFFH